VARRHFILPDAQVKEGVKLDHLTWAGQYIAEKKPEVVVCIGDFGDMESLSSYDVGKKSFEGRRYKKDIEVADKAMGLFMAPIRKVKRYNPEMHFFLGNHEDRIDRAVEADPKMEGVISTDDLPYKKYGWQVHPFLEVVVIDGVAYSHYFETGSSGRAITTASALVNKKHMSCVMGHNQGRSIAYATRADGKQITGLFVGGYYQHDEKYLKWQGNKHWRGCWMLNEVNDGSFDEMPLSLDYMRRKYGR
jgi:hypothetical protein